MALWKKLWLLFTVIWVVVSGLQVVTILAFGEEFEREKILLPILFAIAVPAALYGVLALWQYFKKRGQNNQ